MLDCKNCKWVNPDTCRQCKREQKSKELNTVTDNTLKQGLFNATIYLAQHKHELN
jgi:hypothetical protein